MLFSRSKAVLVALAHKLFCLEEVNFLPLSMTYTWLITVANFVSLGCSVEITWGDILKFHPHPFLFADPFEVNIFNGVVTAQVLDLILYLVFKFLIQLKNYSTHSQYYLP